MVSFQEIVSTYQTAANGVLRGFRERVGDLMREGMTAYQRAMDEENAAPLAVWMDTVKSRRERIKEETYKLSFPGVRLKVNEEMPLSEAFPWDAAFKRVNAFGGELASLYISEADLPQAERVFNARYGSFKEGLEGVVNEAFGKLADVAIVLEQTHLLHSIGAFEHALSSSGKESTSDVLQQAVDRAYDAGKAVGVLTERAVEEIKYEAGLRMLEEAVKWRVTGSGQLFQTALADAYTLLKSVPYDDSTALRTLLTEVEKAVGGLFEQKRRDPTRPLSEKQVTALTDFGRVVMTATNLREVVEHYQPAEN